MVERVPAIAGALAWLAVFVLLTIDELRCLVWLGDGAHPGDSGLATFSVVTTGLALVALIVSPALYLLFPLLLTVDLMPRGLREKVGPGLRTIGWRQAVGRLPDRARGRARRRRAGLRRGLSLTRLVQGALQRAAVTL